MGVPRAHEHGRVVYSSVVETSSCAGQSMARLDLGNDVFVANDRRARYEALRAAPATGCGPMWILEAASGLTTQAPINSSIDMLLADSGCGYDIVSREQASTVRRWTQKAVKPRTCQTANWITTADQVARMIVCEFDQEVAP